MGRCKKRHFKRSNGWKDKESLKSGAEAEVDSELPSFHPRDKCRYCGESPFKKMGCGFWPKTMPTNPMNHVFQFKNFQSRAHLE